MTHLLHTWEVARVRADKCEYGGPIRQRTLKRSATCRCCGEKMPKGTEVFEFCWDYTGNGSWTAVVSFMHKTCDVKLR